MPTEQEELQAKEFLQRGEIFTMKKDLRKLRELDALKERDKITGKAMQKKQNSSTLSLNASKEKFEREKVLGENARQETLAQEQIKQYATEQERQQIFVLEAEKIELDKKAKNNRAQKEPDLAMKKNEIEITKRSLQGKLKDVQDQEEKLEQEQILIAQKEKTTNLPSEKEALEKRRWELEELTKETEKKRWEVERQIEQKENEISAIDQDYQKMIQEDNIFKQEITDIDKQLRDIYSQIIQRTKDLREKAEQDRKTAQTEQAKIETAKKEDIQRQQWSKTLYASEEERRKKFLEDVEAKVKEQEQNKK